MKHFFSPPGVVACRPPEGAVKKVGGLQLGSATTELVPLEVMVTNTNNLVAGKVPDIVARTGDTVFVPRDIIATRPWAKNICRVKDGDGLDVSLIMVPLQEVVLVRQFSLEEA